MDQFFRRPAVFFFLFRIAGVHRRLGDQGRICLCRRFHGQGRGRRHFFRFRRRGSRRLGRQQRGGGFGFLLLRFRIRLFRHLFCRLGCRFGHGLLCHFSVCAGLRLCPVLVFVIIVIVFRTRFRCPGSCSFHPYGRAHADLRRKSGIGPFFFSGPACVQHHRAFKSGRHRHLDRPYLEVCVVSEDNLRFRFPVAVRQKLQLLHLFPGLG